MSDIYVARRCYLLAVALLLIGQLTGLLLALTVAGAVLNLATFVRARAAMDKGHVRLRGIPAPVPYWPEHLEVSLPSARGAFAAA